MSVEPPEVSPDVVSEVVPEVGPEVISDQPVPDAAETPSVPSTGNPALDEALAGVQGLEGLDVHDHPAAFERVHQTMRAVLDGRDG